MIARLLFILSLSCGTPALGCSPTLFERVDLPARDEADIVLDVSEIQSVEGGEWKVWQKPDGGADEIVRVDYGEMGRLETRLLVDGPEAYAITQTRSIYSAPIYVEGAMTVRVETDIYLFCVGSLLLPAEDFAADPDYARSAKEALAMFEAAEIVGFVPFRL